VLIEHRETPCAAYPERRLVAELSEEVLALIIAARQVLVEQGGYYGKKMHTGGYLQDRQSSWQVFAVSGLDNDIARVVFWNEVDDGRFSFHFAAGEREPRFFCYEN
jgi:hypothetical protein